MGLNNWRIVPLLSFTCDKNTILEFEREWVGVLDADLNTRVPYTGLNKKEYNATHYTLNREFIRQQQANYYESNKKSILQRQANYRESNRQTIRQKNVKCRELNIQNKVHHCDVCDKSFGSNKDLQGHFDSLKHQYAYLNSVD